MLRIRSLTKPKTYVTFRYPSLIAKNLGHRAILLYSSLAKPLSEVEPESYTIERPSSEVTEFSPCDPDGLTYDFSTIKVTKSVRLKGKVLPKNQLLCDLMWRWNTEKRFELTITSFRAFWEPLNSRFIIFKNRGENIKMINLVLSAYFKSDKGQEGWILFHSLPQKHLCPDHNTIKIIMNYCLRTRNWRNANSIYASLPSLYNLEPCSTSVSIYCSTLLQQGLLYKAMNLFRSRVVKNSFSSIISYHIFIEELCYSRRIQEALIVYSTFRSRGFLPTQGLFNKILEGIFNSNLPYQALDFYQELVEKKPFLRPNQESFYTLVNGFIMGRKPDLAFHYIKLMERHGFTRILYTQKLWDRLFQIAFSKVSARSELALDLIEFLKTKFELPSNSPVLELNVNIAKVLSDESLITQSTMAHDSLTYHEINSINFILSLIESNEHSQHEFDPFIIIVQRLCQFGGAKYAKYLLNYLDHNDIQINSVFFSVFLKASLDSCDVEFSKELWRRLTRNQTLLNSVQFSSIISCLCRSTDPRLALELYRSMRANHYPPLLYVALKVYFLAQRLRKEKFARWLLCDSLSLDPKQGLTSEERGLFLTKITTPK